MIARGENVVACGRLVELEGSGAALAFWGDGGEWPVGVAVSSEYPSVQLHLAGGALCLSPPWGGHVEVRGQWGEGRIHVDWLAPIRESLQGGSVHDRQAAAYARVATKRSARMAVAEDPLFSSGDLLWRHLSNYPERGGAVIVQRCGDWEGVEALVQVYAVERPGVPVTAHESRHTSQELEEAEAILLDLPGSQRASLGMGLNEGRTDVRFVLDLLYPTIEVMDRLEALPEEIVQVNYVVRPLHEASTSANP